MSSLVIQKLDSQEQTVLEVIQEYLNKNKIFNIMEIVPFIRARFKSQGVNINDVGIKEILISMVKKKIVIEGSKLIRDSVLLNEKRKIIYNYIIKTPGTYFNKILRKLAINNYIAVWHIDILTKFGFIKKEPFDNRVIYYDVNMELEQVKRLYFGSNKKSKLIFAYLQQNNIGISKTKIAKELQMHPQTATKYLDALDALGMIKKESIDSLRVKLPIYVNLCVSAVTGK